MLIKLIKAFYHFILSITDRVMSAEEEAECENVMKRWNIVKSMRMQNIITLEEYEAMKESLLMELKGIEEKYD